MSIHIFKHIILITKKCSLQRYLLKERNIPLDPIRFFPWLRISPMNSLNFSPIIANCGITKTSCFYISVALV